MSSIEAPEITVVQPGSGRQGNLGTIGVAFKLWGHDTGDALSIVEHPFPVGDGGYGRPGQPDAAVQRGSGRHDPLPCLVHLLGPEPHPVRPRIW